jgi:hypothetical protein
MYCTATSHLASFLDDKSTLDAISRVVKEKVGGASQLTTGRVTVHKNRQAGHERGDPRIITPLRNRRLISKVQTGA